MKPPFSLWFSHGWHRFTTFCPSLLRHTDDNGESGGGHGRASTMVDADWGVGHSTFTSVIYWVTMVNINIYDTYIYICVCMYIYVIYTWWFQNVPNMFYFHDLEVLYVQMVMFRWHPGYPYCWVHNPHHLPSYWRPILDGSHCHVMR